MKDGPRILPGTNVTKLVARHPDARRALEERFGPEMVARLNLELDTEALLARELPETNADWRAGWAGVLANTIATDESWFSTLMQPRPGKVAKELDNVHKAARALLRVLDKLPPAAMFGMHMRLLLLDMEPPAMRQVLSRELVYRTAGKSDAGLNGRAAAVAEIAAAAAETRDGIREAGAGKHRAARLARNVANAFEDAGAAVTVSGAGEGPFPRVVAAVLEAAGLRDASPVDVAKREAERRRGAALHRADSELQHDIAGTLGERRLDPMGAARRLWRSRHHRGIHGQRDHGGQSNGAPGIGEHANDPAGNSQARQGQLHRKRCSQATRLA